MTYREEPGKQKTRRRRAQELSRSRAQEKCVVEMEHGSNRPIGIRGRPELRGVAYRAVGREVALEGEIGSPASGTVV